MVNNITSIIQSIRIQDIFDIIILAIMISALLIWFKDRASRFVLIGISLFGVLYVVARFFQLYLTTIVLQGFFAILLFILVVIFQEDLRRFFERLAIISRIRLKTPEVTPYSHTVEIIAQAVANFARRHIGALIVIQGDDPLDRHISGGIALNGIISQPLLESIFDPNSIGHDGAVIIDRNIVTRFGCHLPLSQNTVKYGSLGLRHTAALGLSERSDAICIVVSEERGVISVSRGEELNEIKSASELTVILESFYAEKTPVNKPTFISSWLKENTKEKIIAVVLACILWLMLGYQRDFVRRVFTIPIEYINPPSEWVIEKPTITETKVTLTGPSQAFQFLNAGALKVSINMNQLRIQEGKQEIILVGDMIKTPFNISVAEINPGKISLIASKLVRVNVPIKVVTENTASAGVFVQNIFVSPSSVYVLAPSGLQKDKIVIHTEPIDLKNLTSSYTYSPKLVFPPNIQFEGGKPPAVKVIIKVKKKP